MSVEWYSNHVKPILDFDEMEGIVIAMGGTLLVASVYDAKANECFVKGHKKWISLSDAKVDGWCYKRDIYPKRTKI